MRLLGLAILAACGSTGHPPPEGTDAGGAEIAVSAWAITAQPQTVTLTAPGSMDVTITATRMVANGGEAGPISLTISPPLETPGVTASFGSAVIAADATTSILTINVSETTPSTMITVAGSGEERHGEAAGTSTHSTTLSLTAN